MTDTLEAPERYLVRNQAKCLGCGDTIVSRHTHDFVTCSCGALSVDGGRSYARRAFKEEVPWEELSVYSDVPVSGGGHVLENSDAVLSQTHPAGACFGARCTIHNMSDHSMRNLEQVWHSGHMWRRCMHNGLHPDPDEFPLPKEGDNHVCCTEHCCGGAYG
jgi:hypothetical protein